MMNIRRQEEMLMKDNRMNMAEDLQHQEERTVTLKVTQSSEKKILQF